MHTTVSRWRKYVRFASCIRKLLWIRIILNNCVKNHLKTNYVKFHLHTEKDNLYFYKNSTNQTLTFISSKAVYFKTCVHYFSSNFYFHEMIALQKQWKMFFISCKKLFSFSWYSNFCISVFPSFFPVSHCFKGWFKKNLKVHDVIHSLNKDLIIHYVWYLEEEISCDIETLFTDRVLNTEHFHGKIMQKMCTKS